MGLQKETLPRTIVMAGKNKETRQMQSLVGKKPGSREETKHQDRNSWGGKEEGEQALKPQNQRQSHPAAGRSLSERDSQT